MCVEERNQNSHCCFDTQLTALTSINFVTKYEGSTFSNLTFRLPAKGQQANSI